ncbi:MAG: tripartite tricarboxylate transporter substrate binding protein [Spirochaetales bacterium]|nr:tripartite tricarboxylate transporter substrate binding protein [Spirochaetales bacterium]
MKRFLTLAFVIITAFAVISCSKTDNSRVSSGSKGAAVDFPAGRQVTIVVPYSAGGASDMTARIFASELEKSLGTKILVTNVTGASGAVGLEKVRSSKPDGYTIGYMPVESTMLRALGFTDLSTDDYRFIARAMTIPAAITVKADSPWNTFDDFIAYAKENPGDIQVGNSGTGSIWQIAAVTVEKKTGVSFTHVPFDGAAPAVAALLGGNIQAVAVSPSEVKNSVDSGDLKVLAVLGEERSSVVPDVETATEMGVDVVIQGWGGFAVPKGTPENVVKILEEAAKTAINTDAMKKMLASKGFEHSYLSGEEMDNKAAAELKYFSELIPSLGIVQN